jgi:hypothetical protein
MYLPDGAPYSVTLLKHTIQVISSPVPEHFSEEMRYGYSSNDAARACD